MNQRELGGRHVKIAGKRGRGSRLMSMGLAVLAVSGTRAAWAQQAGDPRLDLTPPAPHAQNPGPRQPDRPTNFLSLPGGTVQVKAIPVNPSDAIALVNNQPITRQQLADECVAKKGKEILDAMIRRVIIEQAMARANLAVTPAEIDEEIDAIAARFGIPREGWLRTLDKERGISPAQYAREIVYPAIALRKLCASRVQVTPKDLKDGFEAKYGEKLNVRMILVNTSNKALEIWEDLRKNTGAFETVAKEQSMDPGTRAMGGLVPQPISRHAYPQNLSDAAFHQLVDGDPRDRDPSHKPKDGDITGPIQVDEHAWVILRREGLEAARKVGSLKDEHVRQSVYEDIYQVKLQEAMEKFLHELLKQAAVENRLTGAVKLANEENEKEYQVDGDAKLMGDKNKDGSVNRTNAPAVTASPSSPNIPPPAALSPEAARQFRPLKPGGNPPGRAATAAPPQGGGGQ